MSKEARVRAREERLAQMAAARRRQQRNRLIATIGGVVIVGLLIAIVTVVVKAATKDDGPSDTAGGPVSAPANLVDNGAILIGQAGAPVTLEIYLDYMCPACGKFEEVNSGEIDRLVKAGTVKVHLRPISFLDRASEGTRYSTRAANAMATVVDRAPELAWAFNTALYQQQPEEGTTGLSDDKIFAIATNAGVSQEIANSFSERRFEKWVAQVTDAAFASGVKGTPTVKINGKVFGGDVYSKGPLTQALEAAAGAK